uniref:Tripartite motif containing 36 n=1 Tax=Ornithorhynchus anatinus TaxID=9258 RepID=A0A6I8P0H9_ORNAN
MADDMSRFGYIMELLAKGKVTFKNIERELICPTCKELFTNPLILPCQHNVCHKCVKELLFMSGEDSFTDVTSENSNPSSPRLRLHSPSLDKIDRAAKAGWKRNSSTPKATVLPCPACKHDVDLGERGIHGLFRNFTLENIVERYRQAARAATAIMCDHCKSTPQEYTKSCIDCNANFCNECFKVNHPWGTVKAQHEYVGSTTISRPKVIMCPEHEAEKVNMYCELCKRPVCHLCKLGGSHANHQVTNMAVAYKTLKEKLTKDVDFLISKESQVKEQISELHSVIKEMECNGEKAKEEAAIHFDKLYGVLEERKFSVFKAIDISKKLRLEKLHIQLEEYQGLLENNGLVGYAQEVLKETDQSCFVQTAKQLHVRIQNATESLKNFKPAAQASFDDYVVDSSKQQELLEEMTFVSNGIEVPEINEELSRTYNKTLITWHHSEKNVTADGYILEYRKVDKMGDSLAWTESGVYGTTKVISDLENNSSYSFRVRGYKGASCSPCSKEVILNTPPAPVFSFLFDENCGYNSERLILNSKKDRVDSRAGFSLLLTGDRIHVGCYTSLDYIIGDTGITEGKHFWAFRVEPYSYLVKVGVVADSKLQEWVQNPRELFSPRYEQDSGHDSGNEETSFVAAQPFTLITVGMKKLFIPKSSTVPLGAENRILPMPTCLGILLEYDKGKVGFYDADRMKCLYERQVECSGAMYPAFALMGSGGIQLEEQVTGGYVEHVVDV